MKKPKILIVEDEGIIALELKIKLESRGYSEVYLVPTGKQALDLLSRIQPDVILIDIMLKGEMDGIETVKQIKLKYHIPVIYLTGNSHLRHDPELIATNPEGFLVKPVFDFELYEIIENTLKKK